MPTVFVSYHHANDQAYKNALVQFGTANRIFTDGSVNTGDISDVLDDQDIREKIRDEYLRDSTVTILLVGTGTKGRKHVDWELYSSMFDGRRNKRSGILVITLPSISCAYFHAAHENEKAIVHPECTNWVSLGSRAEYEERYPYFPERIVDNLHAGKARISVVPWEKACDPAKLKFLVDAAHAYRANNEYDLSRAMRRRDS